MDLAIQRTFSSCVTFDSAYLDKDRSSLGNCGMFVMRIGVMAKIRQRDKPTKELNLQHLKFKCISSEQSSPPPNSVLDV